MPTGYTSIIEERDVSFEEFVWRCARAFGALIDMRDDSLEAAIPERLEPSDYYQRSVREAERRVIQLERMNAAERSAEGARLKRESLAAHRDWLNRQQATNARYSTIEQKVETWQPPTTEHVRLKEFMLEQLRISKGDTSYIEQSIAASDSKTPGEFFADELSTARRRLKSAREHQQQELERVASRNEWLAQLRNSVPYLKQRP